MIELLLGDIAGRGYMVGGVTQTIVGAWHVWLRKPIHGTNHWYTMGAGKSFAEALSSAMHNAIREDDPLR